MSDFLEVLISVMPLPILVGSAILVVGSWIIKELRSHEQNRDLFADRFFQIFTGLTTFCVVGFYAYQFTQDLKKDIHFKKEEIGIYVCAFENDANHLLPSLIEAALIANLKKIKSHNTQKPRVARSLSPQVLMAEELDETGRSRNASIVVSGRFNTKDKYWLRITNISRGTDYWHPDPIDLDDHITLVTAVAKELSLIQASRTDQLAATQKALSDSIGRIELLQSRLDEALDRIARLEARPPNQMVSTVDSPVGERWAVLIGVGEYPNSEIARLSYSDDDVEAMKRLLIWSGIKEQNIITMRDEEATKKNIQRFAIDFLREETAPNDHVIFFFAGHSLTQQGKSGGHIGFICPFDFSMDSLFETGISMSQIKEWFDLVPAKDIILMADSCFSGLLASQMQIATRAIQHITDTYGAPKPDVLPLGGKNILILTAGKANQIAMEGPRWGHGLFTFYVLRGLSGGADRDSNGLVSARELYYYIHPQVTKESDGRQTPQLFGWGSTSATVFIMNPEAEPPQAPTITEFSRK